MTGTLGIIDNSPTPVPKRKRSPQKPKPLPLSHGTFPLLIVTWQDALVDSGWSETDTALAPATITSVGWKISENEKAIVLGSDIGDSVDATTKVKTTETNRRIAIPRDWVTSIKEL